MDRKLSVLSSGISLIRNNTQCPICLEILRDPTSTKCNHHFCSHCVKTMFQKKGIAPCPVCNKPLSRRSFAKDSSSIKVIVSTVEKIIESINEDTGIDFLKEPILPASTREASCSDFKNPIAPQTVKSNCFGVKVVKNSEESNLPNQPENDPDKWKNRYCKRYQGNQWKKSALEDSFLFPADIIHPGPRLEMNKTKSNDKVASWLTKNEKNLRAFDDMSMLDGSLPKKEKITFGPPNWNDDELLSVSQAEENAPDLPGAATSFGTTDLISDEGSPVVFEDEEEGEPQKKNAEADPYEFVSSQKSAEQLKPLVPQKTFSKKERKKPPPPLWKDMSFFLKEAHKKRKEEKRMVTDSSFMAPPTLNDTFDQLFFKSGKLHLLKASKEEKKLEKIDEASVDGVGNLLIFKSQTDRIASWERSSDSSDEEEWAKAQMKNEKTATRRSIKNVTSKTTKRKKSMLGTSRQSKEKKKEDEMVEIINKTFQEIEDHSLMTASQVDRELEEINKKAETQRQEEKSTENRCSKVVKEVDSQGEDTDIEAKIEEITSADEGNVSKSKSSHNSISGSQGWSRVNQLKKDFVGSKKTPLRPLNVSADSVKKSKTVTFAEEEKKLSVFGSLSDDPSCKSAPNFGKMEVEFCVETETEKRTPSKKERSFKENIVSPPSPQLLRRCPSEASSSSGEPVTYLCLSQRSQEEHKVMQNLVRKMEDELKGQSNESSISVNEGSPFDIEAFVAEACENRINVPLPDIHADSSEGIIILPTIHSSQGREKGGSGKTSQCQSQEKCSQHLVSGEEKPRQVPLEIVGELKGSQKSLISSTEKNKPSSIFFTRGKTQYCLSNLDKCDRLLKMDLQSSKTPSEEDRKQNLAFDSDTLGSQLLESSQNSGAPSRGVQKHPSKTSSRENEDSAQNFSHGSNSPVVEGQLKSSLPSDKDVPCSIDPFKSSEKSSEDFPAGQESKKEFCVKFVKASKLSRKSRITIPFFCLGSCMTVSERERKYDRWLIKISSTMPKCYCDNSTLVNQKDVEVQVAMDIPKSMATVKENESNVCSLEGVENNVQKTMVVLKSKESSCSERVQNSERNAADLPGNTKIAELPVLPPQLSANADEQTSDESSELKYIFHGQRTKESVSDSEESLKLSSSNGKAGNTTGQFKRTRPFLSDDSDDSDKQCKKSCIISGQDEIIDLASDSDSDLEGDKIVFKAPSSKQKKKITRVDDVDDDLLNSEELMKRVLDNINEDLGIPRETVNKAKNARKRILSDSDEGSIVSSRSTKFPRQCLIPLSSDSEEGTGAKVPNIEADCSESSQRAPPQCTNDFLENLDGEEDLFKDVDSDNEKEIDVIEGTPVTDKPSSRVSVGVEKSLVAVGKFKSMQSPKSVEFTLPHSSRSNSRPDFLTDKPQSSQRSAHKLLPNVASGSRSGSAVSSVPKAFLDETDKPKLARNLFGTPTQTRGDDESRLSSANAAPFKQPNLKKPNNVSGREAVGRLGSDFLSPPNMLFVCSGLASSKVAQVKTFARVIGAGFSDNFTIAMTHLIVDVDENRKSQKTLKYLQAVAAGKWVVSYNWIMACASAQKLLPEEDYEALDPLGMDGPRRSRLGSGNLFKNIHLCFIEPFENITVGKLQEITMMCGGIVIDEPEDFSTSRGDVFRLVVLSNDAEIDENMCQSWLAKHRALAVFSDWVLDSVGSHCLQPLPSFFLAAYAYDDVLSCGVPEELLVEDDLETSAGMSHVSSGNYRRK